MPNKVWHEINIHIKWKKGKLHPILSFNNSPFPNVPNHIAWRERHDATWTFLLDDKDIFVFALHYDAHYQVVNTFISVREALLDVNIYVGLWGYSHTVCSIYNAQIHSSFIYINSKVYSIEYKPVACNT